MAYHKGRAKQIWTGELAEGVEPGSDEDDRICWHVRVTWQALEDFRKGINDLEEKHAEPDEEGNKRLLIADIPAVAMAELLEPVVIGWENYADEAGNPVPFSVEEMMSVDPNYLVELYARLSERAHQIHVKVQEAKNELVPTPGPGPEAKP